MLCINRRSWSDILLSILLGIRLLLSITAILSSTLTTDTRKMCGALTERNSGSVRQNITPSELSPVGSRLSENQAQRQLYPWSISRLGYRSLNRILCQELEIYLRYRITMRGIGLAIFRGG